jgi:hypothetical protein
MAHLEVNLHHKQITIRSQVFCGTFQDVGNNRKAVFVFLRALRSPETGNPLFTYETIARAFGYADRRNIQNYVGEFVRCGEDFQAFLSRTNLKRERLFPLIAEQVLHCPLLSPHEQYRAFCEAHLDERVSEDTFRTYVRDIDGLSLLKRVQQLVGSDEAHLDPTRFRRSWKPMAYGTRKRRRSLNCFRRPRLRPPRQGVSGGKDAPRLPCPRNCWSWCCMRAPCPRTCWRSCLGWGKRVFTTGFMRSVRRASIGRCCARLCVGADESVWTRSGSKSRGGGILCCVRWMRRVVFRSFSTSIRRLIR